MKRRPEWKMIAPAVVLGLALSAQAATWSWASVGNSNWTNPASWDLATVPSDTGAGTADRVNVGRMNTLTVNTAVPVLGTNDYIIQQYGTLDITTGGTLDVGYIRQQFISGTSGESTLRLSGGTANFSATASDSIRFANVTTGNITSRVDIVSGTLTSGGRMTMALGGKTIFTQSGGTFNSSSQILALGGAAYPNSRFEAVISGGTFNASSWANLGGTMNVTVDGDNQTAVNLGSLTAVAGMNLALRFNLESGWSTKTALGSWNMSSAGTKELIIDFGTLSVTNGQIITLATATSLPNLTGVTLTSLTSGATFINLSDAGGLKIQVAAVPTRIRLYEIASP